MIKENKSHSAVQSLEVASVKGSGKMFSLYLKTNKVCLTEKGKSADEDLSLIYISSPKPLTAPLVQWLFGL